MSKSLLCKITPKEGYVYRNYVCKKCCKTCEFIGHKKDGVDYIKSETSRTYKCPECFPDDVNGGGDAVGILTDEYATQVYLRRLFIDTKIERTNQSGSTPSVYTREGGNELEKEGKELQKQGENKD